MGVNMESLLLGAAFSSGVACDLLLALYRFVAGMVEGGGAPQKAGDAYYREGGLGV